MNKKLKDLTPYELGESNDRDSIKHLIKFLESSSPNERRLAASAVGKLNKNYPQETHKLKKYLLRNLDENLGPQTVQYTLKALKKMNLSKNDIKIINSFKYLKHYNQKILEEITGNQKLNNKDIKSMNQSKWENIFDFNIPEDKTQFKYTDSQKIALKKILSFIESTDDIFILNGAAGTGKTTICNFITKQIEKNNNLDYTLLAPTGRAARIISLKTNNEATTIHKHIYKQDKIVKFTSNDKSTNIKTTFSIAENMCEKNTIYLIDEASMISNITRNKNTNLFYGSGNLLNDIIDFSILKTKYKNKIIFIGDRAQLPPINCKNSPALDKKIIFTKYKMTVQSHTLTDIVRQSNDNKILDDANFLRKQIELNKYSNFSISRNTENCKEMNYYDLENHFVKNYKIGDLNNPIMITHSNFSSRYKNEWIRKKIFKNDNLLNIGDSLIAVQNSFKFDILNGDNFIVQKIIENSYEEKKIYKDNKDKKPIILKFVDIIIIRQSIEKDKKTIEQKVKIILNCLSSNENSLSKNETNALNFFAAERHKKLKKSNKKNKLQTELFDLGKDAFIKAFFEDEYRNALQVKYGYSITCHKSQGGEWSSVYIDLTFSSTNTKGVLSMDYFRWSYTALTRAIKNIYHTNQKKVRVIK